MGGVKGGRRCRAPSMPCCSACYRRRSRTAGPAIIFENKGQSVRYLVICVHVLYDVNG